MVESLPHFVSTTRRLINHYLFAIKSTEFTSVKKGCIAVNILPSYFPHPMNTDIAKISSVTTTPNPPNPSLSVTTNPNPPEQKLYDTSKTNCPKLPVRPSTLP